MNILISSEIRTWVFFPVLIALFLLAKVKQNIQALIASPKKPEEEVTTEAAFSKRQYSFFKQRENCKSEAIGQQLQPFASEFLPEPKMDVLQTRNRIARLQGRARGEPDGCPR